MRLFYVLAPLASLFTLFSLAQDPTANSTAYNGPLLIKGIGARSNQKVHLKKPQPWKKEHDQVDGHIDHTFLKTMEKTTETIIALLKDSGLSVDPSIPVWHGEFVSEKRSSSSRMNFGLECHFQSNAQLRITANDFDILFRDTLYVNGKAFLTLKDTASVKNGCTYFEYPEHTKLWLVTTAPDKLPYIPVTRKEYLEAAIQEVKIEKGRLIADIKERMPLKPAETQKAEKERELDQIRQTYSGAEMEMRIRRFLQSYKTDEDYQKEGIENGTADIDATLHVMDSLLTHLSATDLKTPAVVSVKATSFVAFEDSLPDHRILVQTNPAYFDPALTGEKPQCFLVCWNYDPSEPMAADIDRQLNNQFDFRKLLDLLGK